MLAEAYAYFYLIAGLSHSKIKTHDKKLWTVWGTQQKYQMATKVYVVILEIVFVIPCQKFA